MKTIMNKKGQADFIGNTLKLIPKPILFILFIVLLSVISFLLSPIFNSFGVFCETDGTVVKVQDTNFFSNIKLIYSLPKVQEIGGDSLEVDSFLRKCRTYVNGSHRFLTPRSCVECDIIENFDTQTTYNLCLGDAFKIPRTELSWYKKTFCYSFLNECEIPDDYYYSIETGKYECLGNCDSKTLGQERDRELAEMGSIPYYPNAKDDNSYENLIVFGCSPSLRVEPTLKGIPLFNLQYWAIGILIIILLMGIIKFAKK